MSDVDGSGPIPRRTPRASDGGAPVSGALAIVLAVVAVVAGFLILRSISGDEERQLGIQPGEGSGVVDTGTATDSTTLPPNSTNPITIPPTTQPQQVVSGATVMVVNANFQPGTAGQMSRALESGPGFTMVEPSDAAFDQPLEKSLIYYDPNQTAAQAVANTLNAVLGGDIVLQTLPSGPPPVKSGTLNGAGVVLMLGLDKAGKTLDQLSPTANTGPAVVTNPPLDTTA